MLLSECPAGVAHHVHQVEAPPAHQRRLAEMGIYPGQNITVMHRAPFGTRIVVVQHQRIALDRSTTQHVTVTTIGA
ncbi:FeoA family protein [Jonesia quinghaiensis]|uniref:FeoA family protein n=1 Tax=Jonesia quinghaiensis TaxID=262806 RepID=UPI000403F767|nr:FeoA family protein [Jonesia quinghaiensis]